MLSSIVNFIDSYNPINRFYDSEDSESVNSNDSNVSWGINTSNISSDPLVINFLKYCETDHNSAIEIMNSQDFNETFFTFTNEKAENCLMIACEHNEILAKYIIDFDLFTSDNLMYEMEDATTMMYICKYQPHLIKYVIDSGKCTIEHINSTNVYGESLVSYACEHNIDVFKYLLNLKIFTGEQFALSYGCGSLLDIIVTNRDMETFDLVLNSDKFKSEHFNTILSIICRGAGKRMFCGCHSQKRNLDNIAEFAEKLLTSPKFTSEHIATVNKDGSCAITLACDYQSSVAKCLIESDKFKPEYFKMSNHDCDALLYAAINSLDLVEFIFNSGKLKLEFIHQNTFTFIFDKYPEVALFVLSTDMFTKECLYIKNTKGNTPLFAAKRHKSLMDAITEKFKIDFETL